MRALLIHAKQAKYSRNPRFIAMGRTVFIEDGVIRPSVLELVKV